MHTKLITKLFFSLLAVALVGIGCSTEQPIAPSSAQSDGLDNLEDVNTDLARFGRHDSEPVTFLVRIENVSTGSTLHLSTGGTAPAPHSPGAWAVTRLLNPFFRVGHYDNGRGLEQQAEDGDPSMLGANIANDWRVKSSGIFNTPVGDSGPGPATPGKAFEFMVTAQPGDHLSFTSMFGQSNDLFYSPGNIGIPLFKRHRQPISGDVTRYVTLWDAGTEVNQEPGVGADQAPRQSGPNTGESERRRITRPRDAYTYPRTEEVIKVTITPVANPS